MGGDDNLINDIGGELKKLIKFDSIKIDNNVFRLHYKATFLIMFCASLLTTLHTYLGDPIDCIVDKIPEEMMDSYCWLHSTYSIPSRWNAKVGTEVVYPGIAPLADLEEGQEVKYYKWYQWVGFFLTFQCIIFYLPRYFWEASENGKVKMLVGKLQEPLLSDAEKMKQIKEICKYFQQHRGTHALYAFRFFGLEVYNFVNTVCQIFFIDYFLDGEFRNYGLEVLTYTGLEHEERPDPMVKIFPKVTKCTFHKYGPSGTVEKRDGLCVLPLNIINEKIFIFLWFWLIFLAFATGLYLIFRIWTFLGKQFRVGLIVLDGGRSCRRAHVEAFLEPDYLSWWEKMGDWFLLHLICKNLNVLLVNDLINQLYLEENESDFNTEAL